MSEDNEMAIHFHLFNLDTYRHEEINVREDQLLDQNKQPTDI